MAIADPKPKEAIRKTNDSTDPSSYIEKFSVALMNWELNKKEKKPLAKSSLVVVRK